MFDVFISYRHADAAPVGALVAALREAGLAVWQDESGIEDFASIQHAIEAGLSQSRAVLAWYSARYPESLACQWELTRAFLAGQREGDPRRRVLLINPETSNAHIHPVELRDALYRAAAADGDSLRAAAAAVLGHVRGLTGVFGDIEDAAPGNWYGPAGGDGSNRFVGRQRELWEIHSGLWSGAVPVITDRHGRPLVRLTGMAGSGKSLTAEMYALRFGAAYPGGVFWLRGLGSEGDAPPSAAAMEELRDGQQADFAAQLGIAAAPGARGEMRQALAERLGAGGHYLWVVDDLPGNLEWSLARAWLAPGANGHTLITARQEGEGWAGQAVRLDDLDEASALRLLTTVRKPADAAEENEAKLLVRDLGCHAMALDLAAVALRNRGFAEFRASLQTPDRDALEFAARLLQAKGQGLPHREKANLNLSLILQRSVAALGDGDRDLLGIAAALAPVRLGRELVVNTLIATDKTGRADAEDAADLAMAAVAGQSLAREVAGGGVLVHPLVARAVRQMGQGGERPASLRLGALVALEALLGDEIFDARRHAALADYIAHARAALGSVYADATAALLPELRLLDALYIYDSNHGDYPEAVRVAECLIAYAREKLGPEHAHTLIFITYLGEVYRLQGRLQEAYDTHYAVLAARSQAGNPDTLISANNLALVMQAQGRLQEAREMQEMILDQYHRNLGERDPKTMLAMHNLACTLRDQGEYDLARALAEQALALRREVLGPGDKETLQSQLNLAEILRLQGATGEARQLNAETAAALGGEEQSNAGNLTARNNLAVSLHSEGRFAEAREVMEKVLAERVDLLGAGDPLCIASRISLAGILISLGELPAAIEQAETAASQAEASQDPGNLLILRAIYHAVLARMKQGAPDFGEKSRELIGRLTPHLDHFPSDLPQEETEMAQFLLAIAVADGAG